MRRREKLSVACKNVFFPLQKFKISHKLNKKCLIGFTEKKNLIIFLFFNRITKIISLNQKKKLLHFLIGIQWKILISFLQKPTIYFLNFNSTKFSDYAF